VVEAAAATVAPVEVAWLSAVGVPPLQLVIIIVVVVVIIITGLASHRSRVQT